MKILITGGAGFIGSALVRFIIEQQQDEIFIVDKLSYAAHPYALAGLNAHPRFHFKKLDICARDELQQLFESFKPDAVMHLAAETHVDRSIAAGDAFMHSNYIGTFALLEVVRQYWQELSLDKREQFRFLHISTDEVYGDLPHPDSDPEASALRFNESATLAPSSPYSASKAGSDMLVQAWHRTYGLPTIISRCSNNYGPFQFAEKLIPHMVRAALKQQPLTIYGSGQQIRDWLYVDDHVKALYLLLKKGQVGEIYNIGADDERRNLELVQAICRTMDSLVPRSNGASYAELIVHVEDRPGHDQRYAVDSSKLRAATSWAPEQNFEEGLAKTVAWLVRDFDAADKYRA
ncbi:dTDP-glucose 4,6-dehydratase [Oligella sp. MSHR50489EDL]|uniref:dTDP-glucose 4,6-dehydratase n=1 Tax=Oligella sp. MSHR50489EDL TaxID=3139409 RepID=UPI003D8139E5